VWGERDTGKDLRLTLTLFPRAPSLFSLPPFMPNRSPHANITIKAYRWGECWERPIAGWRGHGTAENHEVSGRHNAESVAVAE
jgi:hypothetical protein